MDKRKPPKKTGGVSRRTPGRWIAHVSMVDEETGNEVMLIRSERPLRGIASIEIESEEDRANAILMAAAPELLASLKGLVSEWHQSGQEFNNDWSLGTKATRTKRINAAERAIVKAERGTNG